MTTPAAVLEVIAGRKLTAPVYALDSLTILTDADLARELIEARKEIVDVRAELDAADTALLHIVECMKSSNNRGHHTTLQICRFFDDLINTAAKIRARII